MTTFQKAIKYLAIIIAICLAISIIGGILGAVGLFDGLFNGTAVDEYSKTYAVSSDITNLDVQINAADFAIKQGDAFAVESNLKHLTVTEENGILKIKETRKFGSISKDAFLVLHIPVDATFKKVDVVTGAGKLTVDRLSAAIMNFELGAGEVSIDTLIATSDIDIDGGAGRITVSDGALHNLDLDMGVGQLNLAAALSGESEFDLGVGETNITVVGNKEEYNLDVEKGIGSITLDGTVISNIKEQNGSPNTIEINGGVGAVNLNFKRSKTK